MHRHVLLFVSALAAAALLGCPGPGPEEIVFEVTPDTLSDFGPVLIGVQSAELTFTVKNQIGGKSGPLTISIEGPAAGAFRVTTDGCSGDTLEAGATCPVGVTMSPLGAGTKSASLVVRDSHGVGKGGILGTATTRALLQASPASAGFGLVPTGGTSTAATLTITNGGTQPTGTLAVSLGGAGANQFTKPSDLCDGLTLAAGASCVIQVRFAPSGLGAQGAAVTITGTPGGTVTIPLGGTGGTPAALAINPTSKDFGTVAAGTQTADTTFTVTNTGAVNATNLAVALTGSTADYVNRGGTCNGLASLAPAVSGSPNCTVIVAFKPVAFGTKGLTVTVTGRVASSTATTQVAVSPTGVGQQTFNVTVANSGTGSGTVTGGAINCGSTCTTQITAAAAAGAITLTAAPGQGSVFNGWTGACASQNPSTTCNLTVDADKSTGAAFDIQRFSLTPVVNALPGGGGSITSPDGPINCTSGSCTPVTYDYNTVVHLTAAAAAGSTFAGWSGDCSGTSPTCDVTMTQARAATANFRPNGNYAFVTSTRYTLSQLALRGDPGGALNAANVVGGADVACGEQAAAAGLSGSYVAWIGSSLGGAAGRLASARGWLRTDGLPFADQLPGNLFYPLQRDEAGNPATPGQDVLTNAAADGTAAGSCSDFTVATGTTAATGNPAGGSAVWSSSSATQDCAGSFRLYCLGVGNTATVSAPTAPAGARVIFTSTGTFTPSVGGIAGAHAICQAEATTATLPGTYKAMLATNNATVASLFTLRGVAVVRPDGVVVSTPDTYLFLNPEILSAAAERTAGGGLAPSFVAWTGADSASTPGTAAGTCGNWTSASGAAGFGMVNNSDRIFGAATDACTSAHALICLQE
ncbi:MAG TPA: choice-of-anchor D domain-containing protein [Myxococcaceae bacterium]|jgi:uncharacterized repeat protein (TIGR02543 family)